MTSYSDLSKCRKKYSIIYSDPPRDYDFGRSNVGTGTAKDHYSTMTTKDIQSLSVDKICAKDAVLFHWGTWPFLKESILEIEAWGFEYKSAAFVWQKMDLNGRDKIGTGFWIRANTEYCLLGTRGKPQRLNKDVRQIYRSIPKRHSQKPDEFRQRIIRLMGDLPRIELFARQNLDNQGWDTFGNDPALKLRSLK